VTFYEDTPYVLTPYQLPRRLARLGAAVEGGARGDRTVQRGSVRGELRAAASTWLHNPLVEDRVGPRLRKVAVAAILTPEWAAWPHRRRPRRRRFAATITAAGEGVAERKLRAIGCYASQWPLFYRTLDDWRATLLRYGRAMGVEGVVERRWHELSPSAP
jgi:hypothetical protein